MLVEIDRPLGDAADHDAIAEHVEERGHKKAKRIRRRAAEKPDHRHRRLLRARRDRSRGRRAAEQRDELAAPHVEHGGLPPRCRRQSYQLGTPSADGLPHQEPARARVSRSLGAGLNCSEIEAGGGAF